jgi:hypothetical protein
MKIIEEPIPELSKDLWRYAEKPYGGFFGNAVIVQVIQEIIANPTEEIHPTEMAESLGKSYNMVNGALNTLTLLKFLQKDNRDPKRPIYLANPDSKRLLALTFFASAVVDDRDGSDSMNEEILDYCTEKLLCYSVPLTSSQFVSLEGLGNGIEKENFVLLDQPAAS